MTPRAGPFMVGGHNLNKLGRGPPCYATYQSIKTLGLMVSDLNFFHAFNYVSHCKACEPGEGPFLAPVA